MTTEEMKKDVMDNLAEIARLRRMVWDAELHNAVLIRELREALSGEKFKEFYADYRAVRDHHKEA